MSFLLQNVLLYMMSEIHLLGLFASGKRIPFRGPSFAKACLAESPTGHVSELSLYQKPVPNTVCIPTVLN